MEELSMSKLDFENAIKSQFNDLVVDKSESLSFFNTLSLPSYIRDWFIKRYAPSGEINLSFIQSKINELIPRKDTWPLMLETLMNQQKPIKILTKIHVSTDVSSSSYSFEILDIGLKSSDTLITPQVITKHKHILLSGKQDIWGVITLNYENVGSEKKPKFKIVLNDYVDFRPYKVDLKHYMELRQQFDIKTWINVILTALDYNPFGFESNEEKQMFIRRLLPFVEKRLNLIEFAPKGTGKSYIYSQISKYGWINSGGLVTRAKLFYDMNKKTDGLIANYDFVCLDEISNTQFSQLPEIQASLKGYLENGKYTIGTKYGDSDAGLVILGNIDQSFMDTSLYFFDNMVTKENQKFFSESALIDRFHGFIEGWKINRMTENKKIKSIGLNTEYFSEILHQLRSDMRQQSVVYEIVSIPQDADTRDTQAIIRLTTAFVKLLFPHWITSELVDKALFLEYCLKPAKHMRQIIKTQLGFMDIEFRGKDIPNIEIKDVDNLI
jgi:ATP-dependent Lon protease